MKRLHLIKGLSLLVIAVIASSCTQEEQYEVKENKTTVKELTAQLRAYNASISGDMTVVQPLKVRKPGLTQNEKISIAIADARGAARGWKYGGTGGAIAGAAGCSLLKMAAIYLSKGTIKSPAAAPAISSGKPTIVPKIFAAGSTSAFSDSVGYYHNMIENIMYKTYPNIQQLTTNNLVGTAETLLRYMSVGYSSTGRLATWQLSAIVNDVEAFRNADTNELSFDEYCDLLKSLNPADGDYIDFAAEYLYAVVYGNVDIDDYTEEVFYMIKNSNAGVGDVAMLNKCIQVAYASVLYSNCTEI